MYPERPVIASSWRRTERYGLSPSSRVDPEDVEPVDAASRLRRAADPVLSQLAASLDGAPYTVILADHDARLVDLRFGLPSARDEIEGLGVVIGSQFLESSTGTNSIATVFETRTGVAVHGEEHYLEAFRGLACYGLPILDPSTRRAAGVLDITCPQDHASSLLRPFLLRGVREIEARLLGDVRQARRGLLEAFDLASTRPDAAVIALGVDVVLTNDAAAELLQPADHAALRTLADEIQRARGRDWRCTFTLTSGREVDLEATVVDGGTLVRAELAHRRAPVPRQVRSATQWEAWPHAELARYRVDGTSVLVRGESGTGRRTVARELAGAASTELDGTTATVADVDAVPPDVATIVVTDVELLAPAAAVALERLARGHRLVLTAATGTLDPRTTALTARCPVHLELPTLRSRRDRIPALAAAMLAEAGPDLRFTPGALAVLAAQDWPGNLGELAAVVAHVARRRQAGDITDADLPRGHREPRAPVGGALRQAERDAVVDALRTCCGNKVQAADMLGISRNTLYRYIRQYRIGVSHNGTVEVAGPRPG